MTFPTLGAIVDLSNFIAKRYLLSKNSKSIINVISLISIVGVFVSSCAMVIVLSGFNGLENLVEKIYNQHESDLTISPIKGKTFYDSDSIIQKLTTIEQIGFTSKIIEEVAMIKHGEKWTTAIMKGAERSYSKITNLDSSIIDGNGDFYSTFVSGSIIGVGIQNQLQVSCDDRFDNTITVYGLLRNKKLSTQNKNVFNPKRISVRGVFNITPEFDNNYFIVSLDFARDLLDYTNELSAIEIGLKKEANLELVKKQIERLVGVDFQVKTKFEKNELLFKTNAAEKWMVFMILLFIFILSTFNIIASLTMLMFDKKRDISTLIALGATKKLIQSIFFKEGLYINLIGGMSGIILGAFICMAQYHFKLIQLENSIIDYWPVEVEATDLFYVLLVLLGIGIIASYLPTSFILRKHFKTYFN
ncbi:MAG: FtsX-like permease family protein [Bacteroidota bacterium]|nr:FtsX-like permease family protein [Bacteroidota bacterium]